MNNDNLQKIVAKKIGVKIDYTPEEIEKTRQEIGNGTKRWSTDDELNQAREIVKLFYAIRDSKISN